MYLFLQLFMCFLKEVILVMKKNRVLITVAPCSNKFRKIPIPTVVLQHTRKGRGEGMSILLLAICSLTTRCH